jgi:hypothetical protein
MAIVTLKKRNYQIYNENRQSNPEEGCRRK